MMVASLLLAATAMSIPLDHALIESVRNLGPGRENLLVRLITDFGHGVTLAGIFLVLWTFYDEGQLALCGLLSLAGESGSLSVIRGAGGGWVSTVNDRHTIGLSFPAASIAFT